MPLRDHEKERNLGLDQAKALLSYDPETGSLRWKAPPRRGVSAGPAGWVNGDGYRIVGYRGREYMACHLIWFLMTGKWPEHGVDHKNRKSDDDRWSNLRAATYVQNNHNRGIRRDNRTGVRGVMLDGRSGKFLSRIVIDGQRHRLGLYDNIALAAASRQAAEIKYFGEFSPLYEGA